jgi:hypothetical protein
MMISVFFSRCGFPVPDPTPAVHRFHGALSAERALTSPTLKKSQVGSAMPTCNSAGIDSRASQVEELETGALQTSMTRSDLVNRQPSPAVTVPAREVHAADNFPKDAAGRQRSQDRQSR